MKITIRPGTGAAVLTSLFAAAVVTLSMAGSAGAASVAAAAPDVTGPTLVVPQNIVVDATSSQGAVVTYQVSAVDDVDGPVAVVCTPAAGSLFPVGTTTVTCSATDSAPVTSSDALPTSSEVTTPPTTSAPETTSSTTETTSPDTNITETSASETSTSETSTSQTTTTETFTSETSTSQTTITFTLLETSESPIPRLRGDNVALAGPPARAAGALRANVSEASFTVTVRPFVASASGQQNLSNTGINVGLYAAVGFGLVGAGFLLVRNGSGSRRRRPQHQG